MSTDAAIRRASEYLDRSESEICRAWFNRIRVMPGADRLFKRVAAARDREELLDHRATAKYALIFCGLGFHVDVEPNGDTGPDLAISRDGHMAVVEVTRFQPVNPGPPVLDFAEAMPILAEYGNPPRDIRKAIRKIYKKFKQIGSGTAIIAIWNDDGALEELEVEAAVDDLRRSSFPIGLSFAVYASDWWFPKAGQIYCFPFPAHVEPLHVRWQEELEGSFVDEAIQRALQNAA